MIAGYAIMLLMTTGSYQFAGIDLKEWGWWILLVCAFGVPVSEILFAKNFSLTSLLLSLAGLAYISFSWGCMMQIRGSGFMNTGWILPVVLIASIWINDTMAYIVGSFIGRTPFSSISPKKTWEGTAGGAVLCVAVVTLAGYYIFGLSDYVSLLFISAIAAVIGTMGDLLESKLKRLAGIKDSGQIMPGHGGFLDRFDSLLLATPFVWLFLQLMK
jgi:phosphatidate cytidylyltransferase